MIDKDSAPASHPAIQCSLCPCGHVCLRWRRSLLLHLDQTEIVCALDCLGDVLENPGCALTLGTGSFSACHAADGFYYLLCQDHVVLRLSEDEACELRSELTSARAALDRGSGPASPRVM